MHKVNLREIEERERKSPKGKFHKFVKNISIALGREPESLDLWKRHPFDLALVRIPTPVTWDEVANCLKKKKADLLKFRSDETLARVEKMGDLFAPVEKLKQKLPKKWKL